MRVARLFLFADWPEKYFSGQSEGRISNASGTRSVRVSAQGLSRSCCKLSPMKIPSSRLAAPGSPRMINFLKKKKSNCRHFSNLARPLKVCACLLRFSAAFPEITTLVHVGLLFVKTRIFSERFRIEPVLCRLLQLVVQQENIYAWTRH